jgi:hypothetical protein
LTTADLTATASGMGTVGVSDVMAIHSFFETHLSPSQVVIFTHFPPFRAISS